MKLFILILLIPLSAFAEKQISKKDMKMLGKIDESTLNAEAKTKELSPENTAKVEKKVTLNCKEQDGRVFNEGEVGYDTCLQNLKNRSMFSKRSSGAGSSNDSKDQNSAGMSIKIGD